ncbi:MAG: DNA mismatch repair endonuclease MutL [Chloroflexota bacterium]
MPIQRLPDKLISQIAAGEVVERPASVVKELLENALDAGGDNVHVMVRGGGRQVIQVSDNGSGIPADEVELAFTRHATSKLRTIEDLERITTLGFRGEALSSIAAVSRMQIVSRSRDERTGVRLRLEGGTLLDRQSAGVPAGTIVTVENLFFNTPARLKFLKSEATEKRQITTLVTRYAMAYPSVRFILEQDGRELLRTTGSGQLADVLVTALGLETFKQFVPVELDDARRAGVQVVGFTSSPEVHRADRSQIALFVNGRWVNDSKLTYAVVQAYHGLLDNGRYPLAVLMVRVPPQEVDVNVHPTKAEVRFRDANAVFTGLQRAVREAVISAGQHPAYGRGRPDASAWGTGGSAASWGAIGRAGVQPGLGLEVEASGRLPRPMPASDAEPVDDLSHIPEGMGQPARPRTLPLLRVVGQVGATYIVAEGPAGLYLIDQHSAHVRVLYETLREQVQSGQMPQAPLHQGETVDLPAGAARQLSRYLPLLAHAGLAVEAFGPSTFVIRAVPQALDLPEPAALIAGLPDDLHGSEADILERLLVRIARHGAVKAGQVLNQEAMQTIVRQLERATEPLQDPTGQPTLLHLTSDQLAREFGR